MPITRLPPNANDVEPVYLYDDPTQYPIPINGIYIDQKGIGRIRSISSTPADIDRLTQTPLLYAVCNNDYSALHAGGPITQYQRNLDMGNVGKLRDWWDQQVSLSANPSLIWLPAGITAAGFDNREHPMCNGIIQPAQWAVIDCNCGATSNQYGQQYADLYFDHCRECGWNGRPGRIIDGQHRIRGMADRTLRDNLYDEKILISLLINTPPNAVDEMAAARMFIEINAGGSDLDRMHKDYLSSHFGILDYSTLRMQSAYNIARDLNRPALLPNNEWNNDTAAVPRIGRIQMMPNTPNCDYLPAWRIKEWVEEVIGKDYIAQDPVTGLTSADTVYDWPAAAALGGLETSVRNELAYYLRAITNQWTGAGGIARTAPKWVTNRTTSGDLQKAGVFRALLKIMPTILRRIDLNGGARDIATFEAELSQLNNISWTGVWNTNLRGDAGINRVAKILQKLLINAPYTGAVVPARWPGVTAWFSGAHDPFTVVNFNSSAVEFTFETETTCAIERTIVEPISIIGEGACIVSVRITTAAGVVGVWEDYTHKLTSGLNTISYRVGATTPGAGDTVEIRVRTSTSLDETLVDDNGFAAGAPVSCVVP